MINIKRFNPNKIKIDEKPYKNILIYYIGYVTPNRVKSLYLVINKTNGYFEESNGNKYSTLFQLIKAKTLKKYEEYGEK